MDSVSDGEARGTTLVCSRESDRKGRGPLASAVGGVP